MATNNNGDERRRRIAERGSDRMALITGRIHALPPTPPSSAPSAASTTNHPHPRHARPQSLSAAIDYQQDQDDDHPHPRHVRPQSLSSAFAADYSGGAEGSLARLKHMGGFRYTHLDNFDFNSVVTEMEPLTQESRTNSEDNNVNNHQAVSEVDDAKSKPSLSSVTSSAPIVATDTKQLPKPGMHKPTFFSSRELNSCIIASENTRAFSALVIALLVVFFYMISESIVATRPLYIVLLTDITIVIARLHHEKARATEEAEAERSIVPHEKDGHNWGDAVKLLERGLVAYQAIRGFFIDCSIYIVVVVCGTSFM